MRRRERSTIARAQAVRGFLASCLEQNPRDEPPTFVRDVRDVAGVMPAFMPVPSNDPRIKVLVLVPTLDIGGAEMDLVRTLPRLDRTRFEVVVCAFLSRGILAQQLIDAGIEVVGPRPDQPPGSAVPDTAWRWLERACQALLGILPRSFVRVLSTGLNYLGLARSIARHIRHDGVDIVHAILPSSYLMGVLASLMTKRRPLVMSRLSLNWYQEKFPTFGKIERRILHKMVDLAIGNSAAVLRDLRTEGLPERKLLLVHNGIDATTFASQMIDRSRAHERLDIAQSSLVLSAVGNLYPYKGHADLLNALHLLRDRLPPDWVLLVVGGDLAGNLADLDRLSDRLQLSRHVRFLGQRQDIPVILSAADVHVSASHTEGFPNNILEAMCAGLPVVATAVGGAPEQVVDGLTGLLVPAHAPAALADALAALAADPERRKSMGRAAGERVALHFPIERSVAALEQAYSRLARPLSTQPCGRPLGVIRKSQNLPS
jgi:glycosyltransferase involved in cell wall biosynthesis